MDRSVIGKFTDAFGEIFYNLYATVVGQPTDWASLGPFYREVLLPFSVGGLIPGLITGLICYYLSVPVITAYQKRRLSKMRKKAEKRLAKRLAKDAERRGTNDGE